MSESHFNLSQSLCFSLNRIALLARHVVEAQLKSLGLTYPQALLLAHLCTHAEQTPTQVAESLALDASTTVGIIARLTDKGFLRKKKNKNDARSYLIDLTAKGKSSGAKAGVILRAIDDAYCAEFKNVGPFMETLEKLTALFTAHET